MKKKCLRPAREQLLWIPCFLVILSILNTGIVIWGHQYHPEYTLEYVTFYSCRIWGLFGLYILTMLSVCGCAYVGWLGKNIVNKGQCHNGYIKEVIWYRAFFNVCEWKCRLVIETDYNVQFTTPFYKYDFLNYLGGTSCKVYSLGKQCYATDFQIVDRGMTREERRAGLRGGWFTNNDTPEFPILEEVLVTGHFREKGGRETTQRFMLFLVSFLVTFVSFSFSMNTFEPLFTDSDGDGMDDWAEFELGTNPTSCDASFFLTISDSGEKINLKLTVEIPAPCDYKIISGIDAEFVTPVLPTKGMPGYIDNPFSVRFPKNSTMAEVLIEFDEALLEVENFYPQVYRFSYLHQMQGMVKIPTVWDGTSNVVSVDFSSVDASDTSWEFYLLDGNAWQTWHDNY